MDSNDGYKYNNNGSRNGITLVMINYKYIPSYYANLNYINFAQFIHFT